MSSPRVTCDASSPAGQTIALLCAYKNISSDVVVVDSKTNPSTPPRYHRDDDDDIKSTSFEGLVPVTKALCGDGNSDDASLLLGATDAEKLAIDDWLAAVNTTYTGVEFDADCEQALESLNEHLKTKSHVAANDRATLADIVLFGAVREKVKQMMASGQLKQKKSLVRWCKRMQSVLSVGEEEGVIDFSAMDATWTALPRSESGGETQVSTSGTKKEKAGAGLPSLRVFPDEHLNQAP